MAGAALAAMLLAGCQIMGDVGSLSLLERTGPAAQKSVQLAGGAIGIAGPEGYCIDRTTLRNTATGGFAALASCHILTEGAEGPIVEPVLVTVTVNPFDGTVPSLKDVAVALETELLQFRKMSAVDAGQLAQGGETAFAGSDPRHWRGVFQLGRYLVGVTVYAPQGSPLAGPQGAAFLNTVSSRIRARSSVSEPASPEPQVTADATGG